ncbi:MAG: DUF255 domain-containing protein [Bacteroidales bacterium]|nr:DUF255 domain-containing protein [Bacteroidales bacterium]
MNFTRHTFALLTTVVLSSVLSFNSYAQQPSDTVIRWKTPSEVQELMKTKPRPIMAFIYYPGEDSSNQMITNTLAGREICTFLNSRFYAIRIKANDKSDLVWMDGKTYSLPADGKLNDLVPHLLGPQPVFPSLLFYNTSTAGFLFKGYRDRYELLCLLTYFSEEIDKTTPYDLWAKAFLKAFPPSGKATTPKTVINWKTLAEVNELQKTAPRPIFIAWYSHFDASSKVMMFNTFEDERNATYLNDNFYSIKMDVQNHDSLFWKKPYIYQTGDKFHPLAVEQMDGKLKVPTLLFYTPEGERISILQSYLGPMNLYALANYAGSGAFRTQKLQEFIRTFKVE